MAEIKHQIPIKATSAKVYAALATQAGLRRWWTADSTADERVGGKAEFGFDKRGMVFRMNIDKLDPGKRVVWSCHGDHPEWDGTLLTWELSPLDGGTTLRFNHSNWKSITDFCATCNSTVDVSPQGLCGREKPGATLEGMCAERDHQREARSTRR